MTTEQLFDLLRSRRVKLWLDDGTLRFSAPDGVMNPELRDVLSKRKPEIIGFLRQAQLSGVNSEIVSISRDHQLSLSFAQERLWFLDRLYPGDNTYNVSAAFQLTGPLDVYALEQSFTRLICRHESLRTTFSGSNGRAQQQIGLPGPNPLPLIDLRYLPESRRDAKARQLASDEAHRAFDLSKGPLFRACLLQLDRDAHILLMTMHHIVTDGWSMGVLLRELSTVYAALREGTSSSLTKLPIQYVDYAAWQRRWLQGEVLEKQLTYWRQQLQGAPASLELPTDRPRPRVRSFHGARQTFVVSQSLNEALRDLSRRQQVSMFMTLLATFEVLLFRYTGKDDICVGTPIANRTREETEGLIGFFVNTLVMRGDLSGAPSFGELLQRVRQGALDAYEHQDLPFEKLVEQLQPERTMSHSPLFQAMFVMQNTPSGELQLSGVRVDRYEIERHTVTFDLNLTLDSTLQGLQGTFAYNTDLFDSSTIQRMVNHFKMLLKGIVADPDQKIGALPLMTQAERRQMLVEWNDTSAEYPRDACIHELFEAQVQRSPDSIAVVFENEQLTYRQLNERANQLAHFLRKRGVGPEVLVGFCVERSLEMVVGFLGVLKAGGAYVPMEPDYPAERLAFLVQDMQAFIVLTEHRRTTALSDCDTEVVCLDKDWPAISRDSVANPESNASAGNPAYVIYTSGSTGESKGVVVAHRQITNYVLGVMKRLGLASGATHAMVQPLSVDSCKTALFPPLLTGGRLHLITKERSLTPSELGHYFQTRAIECLKIAPSHLSMLVQNAPCPEQILPRERLILGGEASRCEWVESLQDVPSRCAIFNHYGPTEATVGVTTYPVTPGGLPPTATVPIGAPLPNATVYVLDRQYQPAPINVSGELYIGGTAVARGYLKRPDMTAAAFLPHPFAENPGERIYKTGDLARWLSDGNLEFQGRTDHQLKIRGFRIEPAEVEAALQKHEQVCDAVVTAFDDPAGSKRLVGYVVSEKRTVVSSAGLKDFLKSLLPENMIPSVIVVLDKLPRTSHGKINRQALPDPQFSQNALEKNFVAPRNPIEESVAEIWQDVLGIERVGMHDNFFELGGHSLLAIQLVSRLRQVFKIELPVRTIFEAPKVADIAAEIRRNLSTEEAITTAHRSSSAPLSFTQQRLWFLNQLEPDCPVYNTQLAFRLDGPLDVVALRQSLAEIVRRHEVLRTTFPAVGGRPIQVVASPSMFAITLVDLKLLPEVAREYEALGLAAQEARLPFDLAQGPVFRATLLKLSDGDHVLLMTKHHIVSDHWSHAILIRELSALYEAFSSGRPSPLSELPIQYADFAAWQQEWLQDELLEKQLDYWKRQLEGMPPTLELPTDRPRPSVQTHRGARQSLQLSSELSGALREWCQREGITIFMILLAAFKTLLYRYTAQDDISVGIPIASRNRKEIEGLVGCFLNSLVLRTDLSGSPSFRELLGRVREVCLGAYTHQDLPFEKLVEELAPERDLARTPLFQIFVNSYDLDEPQWELPDLTVTKLPSADVQSIFDLQLYIRRNRDAIRLNLVYNCDLFSADRIANLLQQFEYLLSQVVANPDEPIDSLSLVAPETTFAQALKSLHIEKSQAERTPQNIIRRFEEIVDAHADEVAIQHGKWRLRYAELEARANRLANLLIDCGARPGSVVAIVSEERAELITAILATLKAGCAFVPLDPTMPPKRLEGMVQQVSPNWFVVQPQTFHSISQVVAAANLCCRIVCLGEDHLADAQDLKVTYLRDHDGSCQRPRIETDADDLVYIYFTSGSTGTPKGIAGRRKGLDHFIDWEIETLGVTAGTRVSQLTPPTFDPFLRDIFVPLCAGGTICLLDKADTLLDGQKLMEWIDEQEINLIHTVPSVFRVILNEQLDSDRVSSLKYLLLAGEALLPSDVRRWTEVYGRRVQLVNLFGSTETTMVKFCHFVQPSDQHRRSIPIGKPIPRSAAIVLDAMGRPCPLGATGEIHVRTPYRSLGYYNRPELTEEVFVPNSWSDEADDLLYKTGDLGRVGDDGTYEFLGRKDHQVKIRGMRVELGEIESCLRDRAEIRDVVVTDQETGSGNRILCAYVVAEQSIEPRALRESLSRHLPNHMVPSSFTFLDALPLTSSGKVNRRALPAPELVRSELKQSYVAPRNSVEEAVVKIWEDLLGIEQVGVHDNFFDLGGHSLLVTQLVSRLRQVLRTDLALRQIFDNPTVDKLAEMVHVFQETGVDPSDVEAILADVEAMAEDEASAT